ncbi:hypothetical protein NE237_015064 [Protea cynaroides]|uniref:Uncharacterized protein n=1 Tax=Protea cynaroides TaxID=273540 RepID=A0A9Q0KD62_9MAGN|nr:hypothetical protein NE237_015064 [Protea cynaroides]
MPRRKLTVFETFRADGLSSASRVGDLSMSYLLYCSVEIAVLMWCPIVLISIKLFVLLILEGVAVKRFQFLNLLDQARQLILQYDHYYSYLVLSLTFVSATGKTLSSGSVLIEL